MNINNILKRSIKSKYGNSPLEYAIRHNSRKVINFLLYSHDFNIENENIYGENGLMMAAFIGNYELS
jgi:ankyrin repeat protein